MNTMTAPSFSINSVVTYGNEGVSLNSKDFAKLQLHEINVHKWIESEKAGYDLGNEAILDWIRNHAKQFREEYGYLVDG